MSSFFQNTAKMAMGSTGSQVIALAAMPFITRIYSPEMFGVYALYLSAVLIFFPVSSLRFASALVLPDKIETVDALFYLSLMAVFLMSALVYFSGTFLLLPMLGQGQPYEGWLVSLISVGVFLQGSQQVLQFWNLRHKQFDTLGIARVVDAVADRGFVLVAGMLSTPAYIFLVVGRWLGPLASMLLLLFRPYSYRNIKALPPISDTQLRAVASEYKSFPLYSTWAFLVSGISRDLPIWVLMAYYSPTATGMFALGQRVLSAPALSLGDALSKTFMQRTAEDFNKSNDISHNSRRMAKLLYNLHFPIIIVLMCYGEALFSLLFGEEWRDAGRYVEILAPVFSLQFIYRVFSVFFDVLNRQRQRLVFDAISFASRLLSLIVPVSLGYDVQTTLTFFCVVSSLVYIVAIFYMLGMVGEGYIHSAKTLLKSWVLVLPFALTSLAVTGLGVFIEWYSWMPILIASLLIQIVALLIFDRDLNQLYNKVVQRFG
jgi:lipopolysaccharide exporter